MVMIDWWQDFVSPNSVSYSWLTDRTPATRSSDFVNHLYDYRPNWIPIGPIIIINRLLIKFLIV